jgi:hypothetical protein
MDDYAKSAFLWAIRELKDSEEVMGICCTLTYVLEPVETKKRPKIWASDIPDIFPLFQQMFDGFAYCYDWNGQFVERIVVELEDYWFFPKTLLLPRESLIHCLLSHSPM